MHVRTQVRNAIKQRLVDAVNSVDGQVFSTRDDAGFEKARFPVLALSVVTSRTSNPGSATGNPALQRRLLDVEVTVLTETVSGGEEECEELAIEVEEALAGWSSLPVKLVAFDFNGDEFVELAKDLVGLTLRYTATVATREGRADTSLHRS